MRDYTIKLIEGYGRDLGLPPGVLADAKDGKVELWNTARPFPAHEHYRGDFLHGVFYGIIHPDAPDAEKMREGARSLDAHRIEFVSRERVLREMQAYYDEHYAGHDIDVHAHDFKDVAMGWLGIHDERS